MAFVGLRLFACSLLLFPFAGFFLLVKYVFRKHLTAKIQYMLWLIFPGFLLAPFLPFQLIHSVSVFSHLKTISKSSPLRPVLSSAASISKGQTGDFFVTAETFQETRWIWIFFFLWITGFLIVSLLSLHSFAALRKMRRSAFILRDSDILRIFSQCQKELNIRQSIPLYCTAALKSPVCAGIVFPGIYLPDRLMEDFSERDLRFMLLHELRHYRQKDNLINLFLQMISALYWFHPLVWIIRKEIRCDREVACDCAVLEILSDSERLAYGNTLICFAEKNSPFSFAAGLGSTMRQMKRRISNIAGYHPATRLQRTAGYLVCLLVLLAAVVFTSILPARTAYGDSDTSAFSDKKVSSLDLSREFGDMDGCFVLYDQKNDQWNVYQEEEARQRISPASTYKIYDALLALESGTITPQKNQLPWNGKSYPFQEWEQDQTLDSAIQNSVNWYFQELDASLNRSNIQAFLNRIDYGNQRIGDDLETYWLDESLKISAVEQVELLIRLEQNQFGFDEDNVRAVKKSLLLSSDSSGSLYGKTGTVRTDQGSASGWFIGYMKYAGNTYYFAANVKGTDTASGQDARNLTMDILSGIQKSGGFGS